MPNSQRTPQSASRPLFPIVLILVWLMLAFYSMIHKPTDNTQIATLMIWLPNLLIGLLLVVGASVLGHRLLAHRFNDQRGSILALGLDILSLFGLVLGLIGALRSKIAQVLMVIAARFDLHIDATSIGETSNG